MSITTCSNDVIMTIATYLSTRDAIALGLTCKTLDQKLLRSDTFWRQRIALDVAQIETEFPSHRDTYFHNIDFYSFPIYFSIWFQDLEQGEDGIGRLEFEYELQCHAKNLDIVTKMFYDAIESYIELQCILGYLGISFNSASAPIYTRIYEMGLVFSKVILTREIKSIIVSLDCEMHHDHTYFEKEEEIAAITDAFENEISKLETTKKLNAKPKPTLLGSEWEKDLSVYDQ